MCTFSPSVLFQAAELERVQRYYMPTEDLVCVSIIICVYGSI